MKKRPTLVGLFSFGGPCPREGRGISFPYLAHAGAGGSCHSPCGLTGSPGSGTPARRRRTPAPKPPAMRAKGPSLLGPLRAAYRLRPPAGARAAAAARSRGPGSAGGRHPQRGAPGRYARPQGGAGGADGPTAPTLWGPGRAGAPTPQPARGRSNARPGQRPAPQGLGLALRRGTPAQRLAANLTGTRRRRGLGRHMTPTAAGGRGGRRPAAQGGQGSGPQAAGGGRDGPEGRTGAPTTARRRWPLFPLPAAVASDGGRVWGVTQQRTAAGAAEHSSAGPSMVGPGLMCGR